MSNARCTKGARGEAEGEACTASLLPSPPRVPFVNRISILTFNFIYYGIKSLQAK